MDCRTNCGACCTAPSISAFIPGLNGPKPAGVPCPHLMEDMRCDLFGDPRRPKTCGSLQPLEEMCGNNRQEAMSYLDELERLTTPD